MNNTLSLNSKFVRIHLLFFAKLKEVVGKTSFELDIPKGMIVSDLKKQLVQLFPSLEPFLPIMLVSINQNFAFDTDLINEDCEIALFPPVSGGSMNNDVLVKVSINDFDFNTIISDAILRSTGAVVLFTGVIRGETDNSSHPTTTGLEYEAYIPMAESKMQQVADEIKDKWPSVQKIVIIQRIGYMDAGTPTVIVLCSAAHRNTGVFDAAKYGIDRVKEIVPIWKKEIGPDGETWVEGDYIPEKGD